MSAVIATPRRRRADTRYEVTLGSSGTLSARAVESGHETAARVYLDDRPIADAFWASLSPRLADWGDVAVAVYAADRLCRRPSASAGDWTREIRIDVPVREPRFWASEAVSSRLHALLLYLTDDVWDVRFIGRVGESRPSENPTLFEEPIRAPASAALFSGGLDSLAGLVQYVTQNPDTSLATFSAQTASRVGAQQRILLTLLKSRYPGRLYPASARFGFKQRVGHTFDDEERTQRTRGFAFQTFGAITAELAGSRELMVFENGVGAINLPYIDSQLGSQCTRATNPVTLRLVSDLASAILEKSFRIWLPFVLRTKREMCHALIASGLGPLVQHSISCDHFPQRSAGRDQCGACGSCLLRRQALFGALAAFDRPSYVHSATGAGPGPKATGWFVLHAMDSQVVRLERALCSEEQSLGLGRAFPSLNEAIATLQEDAISRRDVLELYQRYCSEWREFRRGDMGRSAWIAR